MPSPELENILNDWQRWNIPLKSRPKITSRLKGGLTNLSYLMSGQVAGHENEPEKKFVLRLHSRQANRFGINRSHEKTVLEALKPLGISPTLLYWANEKGYSVFTFISGRTLTSNDLLCPIKKGKIHDLIQRYQRLEISLPPFDYLEHLKLYWNSLSASKKREVGVQCGSWQRLAKQINIYSGLKTPRVLTHHDLNPANFLISEDRLYLLDWEYAGLGFGEFDSLLVLSKSKNEKKWNRNDFRVRCVLGAINWLDFTWKQKTSSHLK